MQGIPQGGPGEYVFDVKKEHVCGIQEEKRKNMIFFFGKNRENSRKD